MSASNRPRVFGHNLVWSIVGLTWVAMTQPTGGSGGGDASAANQLLELAKLTSLDAKVPALGQALAVASTPVVLTAVQVTALTPPAAIAGFALEAGHLATIDTKTPALGQALAAASVPVILPSATITTLTPPAAISGFALEAGHLAAIDTSTAKIPSQGQALAAASLPVVLTAIQVSTLTPPAAITGFALDAHLTDRTQKTQITDGTRDGTVKAASTLPLLTDTAVVTTQRDPLPAGTNVLGHVIIDSGSVVAATLAAETTKVIGTVNMAAAQIIAVTQATAANLNATVTPIALTKGAQGATGFSVQRLNDAGRNTRIFMLDTITAAPVAEALATVVQWYGNAAVAGTTTPAVVPAGKTLRLTGYKIQYQSLATVGYAVVRIRANTGGVAVLASPLVTSFEAGSNAGATTVAMTGGVTTETGSFPEGLELPAGTGVGFSFAGYGPTGTLTLEGGVRFEVHGYEY